MQSPTDTIAAISSPPGRSARGLIRISGPAVSDILEHLLEDATCKPRELLPVRLKSPAIPAMLLHFRGPASYTGDDLAELQLPGNPALLDRVLNQIISLQLPEFRGASVRLAEPGEFTFRAYTAGKLDLTQAEGVGATITAVSDSQLAAAGLLRNGKLGQTAETLVDQLGSLLALVEAGIDFTDQEDVTPIPSPELAQKIDVLTESLGNLLARSRSWGAIEALPRVVLVGPPSAGKSTLFNALLGRERAVIDAAPGTTRDALAEPLQLTDATGQQVEVMLVDLAGLDKAFENDAFTPDRDAQRIAYEAIQQADLILRLSDTPGNWLPLDATAPTIDVLTKQDQAKESNSSRDATRRQQTIADLSQQPISELQATRHDDRRGVASRLSEGNIPISAHTGRNLTALRTAIAQRLSDKTVSLQADLLALQPRHEQAIQDAAAALQDTHMLLKSSDTSRGGGLPDIELLATTMRSALDALASLGGQLTPDEVIGRVFATFCVGK